MSDTPEFHGNPNDYDFNPEFVFNLKAENATLKAQLTAEQSLSGALREALVKLYSRADYAKTTAVKNLYDEVDKALAQYTEHKG